MGVALGLVTRSGPSWAAWQQVFGEGLGRDKPTKSYSQVGIVYACVQRKADAMARMSMTVSTGDDQVIESGPLVKPAGCPNPPPEEAAGRRGGLSSARPARTWTCSADRVEDQRPGGGASGAVAAWPLMPARLSPVRAERTGAVTGWLYRHHKGRKERLTPEQVHSFLRPGLRAGRRGDGLVAAGGGVAGHRAVF